MATADHDSRLDVDGGPGPAQPAQAGGSRPADQEIWLDGDVLACACPDCGGPMSIRLWLLAADCWRCGASIELSEAQHRQAVRLVSRREASRRAETHAAGAAITPTALPVPRARPPTGPRPEPKPPPEPTSTAAAPTRGPAPVKAPPRRRVAAADRSPGARAGIRARRKNRTLEVFFREFFRDLPAWLVSLVLHLVAILLLGLWAAGEPEKSESITLATAVSYEDLQGDTDQPQEINAEAFEFDPAGATGVDELALIATPGPSDVVLEPEAIAPPDPGGMLPQFADLTMALPAAASGTMFAGRDPRLRRQLLQQQGGTAETEAAVARGLQWLARHQFPDGHWSLDAWHRAPGAAGRAEGLGGKSDTAGTALALLPFLGAGQTHLRGRYHDVVFQGLRWLMYHQKDNGDLRGDGIGRMYAHGQAAIVLSEAYALSGDAQLRGPAQSALNFIVHAQHRAGGWRYQPGDSGDTSMIGWQLIALRSGKMAYLRVPQRVFELADHYLDTAATDRYGSQYAYRPRGSPSHVMTAEALLCRQYLGWPRDHGGLQIGVRRLVQQHPPDARSPNMYYWYYATQVMHNMGGDLWKRWNAQMRSVLVDTQRKDGPMAGSWDPRGGHSSRGGRIYMTALALCTLEIYYRYLPMYRPDTVKQFDPPAAALGPGPPD